ncbi:probable tyrosyl-DNA phosphodiesterase isoform X2 [Odontomachus brunneus]|nr:probable tyrosyl-DNA phosphodiesterase isoform X2 [Odontomachus brunneus]
MKKPSNFGCHHTKITILQYSNGGIRVVVSTANLFSKDWEDKTQGLWISPHLPPLPEYANLSEGESGTNFKKDLRKYLSKYENPALHQWIEIVKRANFFDVNVFLVASVPGDYKPNITRWGHRKLSRILSHYAALPKDASKWPLIAQSSSIGSLGSSYKKSWLSEEIVVSMSHPQKTTQESKRPEFKFIYPSLKNYKHSYDCNRSFCLSYSMDMHDKQKWIELYLYQWRAERTGRTRAMPHIKSYTRVSPDLKRILWFVLTSANLSKAAWGVKQENKYSIKNFEAGVVFLPKFITATTTFPIKDRGNSAVPIFPIPYDLPLHRYHESDTPCITRKSLHSYQPSANTDPKSMVQNELLEDEYN